MPHASMYLARRAAGSGADDQTDGQSERHHRNGGGVGPGSAITASPLLEEANQLLMDRALNEGRLRRVVVRPLPEVPPCRSCMTC